MRPPLFHRLLAPRGSFSADFGSDVALEDLAVVADGLDRAVRPVLVEAEQLAGVFRRAEDALHDRIGARLHLVDVRLRDAVLLGFDQREDDPLDDREPLVVTAAHRRSQRLLGNQLGQDHVVVGIAGFLVAHRGQARGVRRVGLAAAGEEGLVGRFLRLEHHRLHR